MTHTKKIKWLFVTVLISLIVFNCSNSDDNTPTSISNEGTKILPLGDSRVEGARPEFESYRYELWKNIVSNNQRADFIGPVNDEASYPQFMGMSFDFNHAGVGGFTTSDVLSTLNTALSSGRPDIALLGIGGNDLLGGVSVSTAIQNINSIIDRLQAENQNITILLEQIAPGRSNIMNNTTTRLFNDFNEAIALIGANKSTSTSQVIIVNMQPNWSDAYMADDVHYNQAGAKVVADRYYAVIQSLITD